MTKCPHRLPLLCGLIAFAICWIPFAARAEALRIFAWRADTAVSFPGAVPMVWANPASYQPHGSIPGAKSPIDIAKAVAAQLHQYSPGSRALIISYAGALAGPNGEPPLFPPDQRLIQAYAIGGFTAFTTEWMTTFWQSLDASGNTPDIVILDYENAAGIWGLQSLPQPHAVTMKGEPAWAATIVATLGSLYSELGSPPTQYAPLDYVKQAGGWQWNASAVGAFNAWFAPRRTAALRTSIFQPAWKAFNTELASLNYGEQRRAWPGVDSNGWVLNDQEISGTWSSPPAYLLTTGGRYTNPKDSASRDPIRALEWLDRRNDVRSAFAVSTNVAPWYSNPDYGLEPGENLTEHRLRWAAGLLADRSIGISTMLLWSDRAWSADEVQFATPIFNYLKTMTSIQVGPIDRVPDSNAQDVLTTWLNVLKGITPVRPMAPVLYPAH